jgi:uncharacterized phiE125 gp8 family phage protein
MLTLVEAPEPFISTAEAKKHLNVVHSRDDAMIDGQIASAIAYLDGPQGYVGAAIARQTWNWKTGAFTDPLRIPLGPVASIVSLQYRDTDGATVVLDPSTSYLASDALGSYLRPIGNWPTNIACRDDAVSVTFIAGRLVVPPQLKSAALLLVGQLYLHREMDVDVRVFQTSFGAHDLARPYRVIV